MSHFLWTQKQDIGPRPRFGHAMTYDSGRKRVLLFGGASADGTQGDTWEWDGTNWTQVADTGPRARRELALAYDNARRRAVLFGGMDDAAELMGDTWEWDGENWTQIEDTGPAPRCGHAMAYDTVRGRVVLFGGRAVAGLQADTWRWDGENWTQEQDTGPQPRARHVMAYDSIRHRLVLFGGSGSTGAPLGDTWTYDGDNWTQAADTGPAPCSGAAIVFALDQAALFGGAPRLTPEFAENLALVPLFGRTWQWDGDHWTEWQDIGPAPRWLHAMAYDGDRRRIVLFGGLSAFADLEQPIPPATFLGETWEHEVTAAPVPPAPGIASLVLNPTSAGRGGVFGKDTDINYTVTLSAPQLAAAAIQITCDVPDTLPRQLLIPAGLTSAQGLLVIHTNAFTPVGSYHVTASLGASSAVATLTII